MTTASSIVPSTLRNDRGVALVVVLLVTLAVSALIMGSTMIATNSDLIHDYQGRMSVLDNVSLAGLEEARSKLNGGTAVPSTGYATLENNVQVYDAQGTLIPDVRRSTYVGLTGITSGQYGVYASLVSVVTDDFGNRVVRRREVQDESFAKFAYFTDNEGGNIVFGGGDQIFGPLHSNDQIKIHSTGATFHSTVTTAEDISGEGYGTFKKGYSEGVPVIPMPVMKDLTDLKTQATPGKMVIISATNATRGWAQTRIEFVALDLNADGDKIDENEGFIRVFKGKTANDARFVVGDLPSDYSSNGLRNSETCGARVSGAFKTAKSMSSGSWLSSLQGSARRCYLGGADSISNGFVAGYTYGDWVKWPGTVSALLNGRADREYLWPINRPLNPDFKGVIYIEGDVAVSGTLRGRVTVAATGNIIIADDIKYATDPASQTCRDMMGLFTAKQVIVSDNPLNQPTRPKSDQSYLTYDDTKDEFIHSVVLALDIFTVLDYDEGPDDIEKCETTTWGRGCLYLTGGIIQETRGAVGTTGGTGYLKRYAYDQCVYDDPPPYFPTIGHFANGRTYEINPTGFTVDGLFDQLAP